MHAWIHSTLILIVTLIGICFTAWAEDMPAASTFVEASSVIAPISAPASEADQVAPQGQAGLIEDEEAPTEAMPVEPLPEVETQAASGPKSETDKLAEKFMELDVDESNGVSMDEYITIVQQRVMARYAAMDADGNGEVTEDEYRIFWKSRMAKWYRLQR